MIFTSPRRKQGRNILYIYKKKRFTTVNSHVSSRESNNPNTPNSDNIIRNSNIPHINVHTKSSFNTLINFQRETNTDSSISINDETIDKKYK